MPGVELPFWPQWSSIGRSSHLPPLSSPNFPLCGFILLEA